MAREVATKIRTIYTTKALDASIGAYAAEDVLSNSDCTTAGVATVWTFSNVVDTNGKGGYITKAMVVSESEDITPRLTLFLFNSSSLSCNLIDNSASTAPNHADLAEFIGAIEFPAMIDAGDDSYTIATPSTYGNLPLAFQCAVDDNDIYGILITRDAFTQTATDDMTVFLTIEESIVGGR